MSILSKDEIYTKPMKTKLFLIILTILSLLLNIKAEGPGSWPTVIVNLSYWSREYEAINETCTSSSCGATNSIHPQKMIYNYEFNRPNYFNNWFSIYGKRYYESGPVYHMTSIWEQFIAGNSSSSLGYDSFIISNGSYSITNRTTLINPVGIEVGPQYITLEFANGTLTYTSIYTNYNNVNKLTDDHIARFESNGGNENYLYTYKIYFTAQEYIMIGADTLSFNGDIFDNELTSDGGTVYHGDTSVYGFSSFIRVTVRGSSNIYKNVTLHCDRPYFRYQVQAVVLESYEYDEK